MYCKVLLLCLYGNVVKLLNFGGTMSGNDEEKCDAAKMLPLDLARTQMKGGGVEKTPIVIPGQHLRSMRVLTQSVTSTTPTIITTNILPSAVLKPGLYCMCCLGISVMISWFCSRLQ